jgi:hypothetical protein
LHKRLYPRAIFFQVDDGVQTKGRITQTALHERKLVRRQTSGDEILAKRLAHRVEDFLIFSLRRASVDTGRSRGRARTRH